MNASVWWKRRKSTLILIFGVGAFLRLYDLGFESFWLDEAMSIYFAQGNLVSLIGHPTWDPHPPLYYIILHFWIDLFGTGEFTIRFLSALFGILSIPVIYKFGKLLFETENGLYSTLLLAISMFHITYSQEARMYSLLTFLSLVSLYCFLKILKENKGKFFVGYAMASILMIYTHYYGVFILFFQNVFFLMFWKRHKKIVKAHVVIQLIIFLSFVPWLLRFYAAASFILEGASSIAWIAKPDIVSILGTIFVFSNSSGIYTALVLALPFFRYLGINKTNNGNNLKASHETSGYKIKTNVSYNSTFCILWFALPIILSFIISFLTQPIYMTKYLIVTSPAYYVLIAEELHKIKIKKIQVIIILIILLSSMYALATSYYTVVNKEQWREVANYIEENAKEDDLILLYASYTTIPFNIYFNGPNDVKGINTVDELKTAVDEHIQVWLIISHEAEGLIKKEMENTCLLKHKIEQVGVKLYYYANEQ